MSDLKIVTEQNGTEQVDGLRSSSPMPGNDGLLTRRDLDLIKRDLITVRKDYNEIRENMVILMHQHSGTPSRAFFVVFGLVWLALMGALIVLQPLLTRVTTDVIGNFSAP